MSGRLPAVVRAMILASLPLCALVAGCGSGSDSKDLFGVPAEDLAASGIVIRDLEASDEPRIPRETAMQIATGLSSGSPALGAQLVALQFVEQNDPSDRLFWAVEVDATRAYECVTACIKVYCEIPDAVDVAITFVDATSGDLSGGCYQHIPSFTPAATVSTKASATP
jgi:hypothetical protein